MKVLLFLDFDGVVHPRIGAPAFQPEMLGLIDDVLSDFPDVSIVVSSTWRTTCHPHELVELLGPLGKRVIGQTPELNDWHRFDEVKKYLKDTGQEDVPWIAIDDNRELYPVDAPVIYTQGSCGISRENSIELRTALYEINRTGSNANVNRCIDALWVHPGPKMTFDAWWGRGS